ncbi:hypothetical protein FRACYDRAFT_233841 [Fragilariopsis cylindrus CCMP1102]|uniref:Uncharacterized protein n=1 Tax=Fragilariopsis cylindrus CCMP1102 TaxID=635003 RepID=A0A1E7FZU1_9STRA|nr:hypothetical protein FRACYDRAFT_233841 [Fragilariopsis cylindrus CCMP1102]|eukprot:OEU23669.1 hypothetical protein FRACYDRAFT_233841 [Fragilariopsis cylindrus CCMP1102]
MNNNNSGDEDEDDADEQQQVEQQRAEAEAAAAAVAETQKEERMELISVVLEKKKKVPQRTRNKIDKLVEQFLQDLGDDIHEMLCDTDENVNSDIYRGLDSNRDTVAEVETAIRFFPDVLSRKVLARLAIESGSFEEQYRGGLIYEDDANRTNNRTILECLMYGVSTIPHIHERQEHHELVDNVYLDVMKELKEIGLMVKEDILRYELLEQLFGQSYLFFVKERFRFLVEWDPTALIQTNEKRCIPLHFAAVYSMQAFRVTFEAGIRYFPKKIGIAALFFKDEDDKTPYQDACKRIGREKVMKVIDDTLTYYHSDTPLNIADTLLSVAIDDDIHLDCVYYVLRRQPGILQELLSAKAETAEEGDEDKNSKIIRKRKRKS